MEYKLTKQIVRVGNSAGVLLPKEWLHGMAIVELVNKPTNIRKEVMEIINDSLVEVMGVYLTGSYARGEETPRSDVDIVVITNTLNKRIIKGKYNIIFISKEKAENALENNILPLLPMLKEAKAIINQDLMTSLIKTPLTKRNLSYYIETTTSAISVIKSFIELNKLSDSACSDSIAYSLILRLRSFYIVDCLIKNKFWSNAELIKIIKHVSGLTTAYEGYLRVKDREKEKEMLTTAEAEKILKYVKEGVKRHAAWLTKIK